MTYDGLDVRIEICCDAMDEAVMMNDIRKSMWQDDNDVYILWGDGDTMPLRYCPNCGKKIKIRTS